MNGPALLDGDFLRRRRVTAAVAAGIVLLALVEATNALVAPLRAPTDEDWRAAASEVRAGFRPGDLVVAAPAWSDQVMRLHLGDLVPIPVAGRLDAARFGRVWEISQRGAESPDAGGARIVQARRHGALTVRLRERRAAEVSYDFVERWAQARVARVEPGRGELPCERLPDRHQCPDLGFNFVKPQLLEIDTTMRQALYAQPVDGATVAIEFPDVPLGRELAVGAGLHHVWHRRNAEGKVFLRVLVDGVEIGRSQASNRSGWRIERLDTSARAGQRATVRFEVSADKAFSRHFGFAAEARS